MEQPEPCSDLATCRETVAFIAQTFDTQALRYFTVGVLTRYEKRLLTAIQTISGASIGGNIHSREAIQAHLYIAIDKLGLAIIQLEEKGGERGRTQQFHNHLRACQASLRQALQYWM